MKRILRIIGLVLLGLLVISTFMFLWQKSRPKVVQYTIVTAQKGDIQKSTVATGKVEPRNEILIKPQMSGIISEVYKEAGDMVKAGDIIAKIQVVPDMVNLSSAESRVERAKLAANQSRSNYERDLKLYQNDVISREEFEKVELQYKNDEEELRAATDNLSLVRTGITQSSAQTSNTLVRSTVDGTILDIPVKVGNSVIQTNNFNDGTTVASVADLSDMLFIGKIDETEVGRLTSGMPIEITIGAIQGRTIPANLEYISPKGTEESGAILFEMKAALKIPEDLFIRAGYSANANIILDKREQVLTIPESSLEFSGDSAFVYMVKNEEPQEFERHFVKIGLSDGINIEVTEGLKENDRIRGSEIIEERK
ncbi:MAG: efflux RND transporter periplasmic adaptor subunit [Fermentimonas caenicola]|jgi:HlyD family secretion protein|uniref:efflux RND transporter periplasmic adaptor subunit n=1 Tax=Lascolabacillus TaxID=1924067 RepID=UPI0006B31B72|nr:MULTISPECIES: efflux RND transporter periplasmic adaptor subunit [Lascolabacillus]MBP6174700.1 efflux RND transporter periplasmic adaptor subunit [Fermentimonas sp.]TAH61629.1 MAG: efflux RND transporter periplasmic adaptor subunit [Fermentimonas caenicola]MCK9500758.1 efflux RND transporter periplasmic adaptor subunit [Lascolabacillus sp.]MDD2606171.1 efflux RND transporter periplasmic adaptor subunit [Lascolabacillus sp.]MDD3657297.1 efflux RND transporter periplasmic adaptor subunit [Las